MNFDAPRFLLPMAFSLLLAACGGEAEAPAPKPARPALTVTLAAPQQLDWAQQLAANGTVHAWQEAVIGAEIANYRIGEVLVQVGERVRGTYLSRPFEGQVLSVEMLGDGRHFKITVKFDRPVNVSKFDSMVIERQRVTAANQHIAHLRRTA